MESILDPTIHNNQMVSLNAVNLFIRGPTVEALIVTQKRLNWTPAMMNIQPSNIPFRVTLTQETYHQFLQAKIERLCGKIRIQPWSVSLMSKACQKGFNRSVVQPAAVEYPEATQFYGTISSLTQEKMTKNYVYLIPCRQDNDETS